MEIEEEEWRQVVGYEGFYEVSSTGKVMSVRSGLELSPFKSKFGYLRLELNVNGKAKKHSVHRLVAFAFIPKVRGKNIIHHKNNIPWDNRVINLEWSTPLENIRHASKQGRLKDGKGSNNSMANLTEEIVLEIRKMADSKKYKQRQLASIFGLDERHVSLIVLRKRWKHI